MPGASVTTDQQLAWFEAYCPNKPNKYGIKIIEVANVKMKYIMNATFYLGKENTPRNK